MDLLSVLWISIVVNLSTAVWCTVAAVRYHRRRKRLGEQSRLLDSIRRAETAAASNGGIHHSQRV